MSHFVGSLDLTQLARWFVFPRWIRFRPACMGQCHSHDLQVWAGRTASRYVGTLASSRRAYVGQLTASCAGAAVMQMQTDIGPRPRTLGVDEKGWSPLEQELGELANTRPFFFALKMLPPTASHIRSSWFLPAGLIYEPDRLGDGSQMEKAVRAHEADAARASRTPCRCHRAKQVGGWLVGGGGLLRRSRACR